MIHHYRACSIRSRARAAATEASGYTYEVVIAFTRAGSSQQIRHEHQGDSFAIPGEAQHAGLRWAMDAIDSDFCTP
jgi:hypothetical protein